MGDFSNVSIYSGLKRSLLSNRQEQSWIQFFSEGVGGSKTLVMVGQNQNKVVLNFDWWVMAKYISTHFDKFYVKLVCSGLPQGTSKRKIFSWGIWIGLLVAFGKYWEERRNPPKKCFFQKMWFSSVMLVNKPLKALCLSSKMVYQHSTSSLPLLIVDLLTFKDYWRSNSFFNGNFRGC